MPDLDAHYNMIVKAIADGRVVPFLGAGVNLCGRPDEISWEPYQSDHLPSGGELAQHLAEDFDYPSGEMPDLARVSQYIAVVMGSGPLYDQLHDLFDADYPPTPLHRFLASLPATLREKGYPRSKDPRRQQLVVVTTNYDDLMERAFDEAGESFHLVSYIADGEERGKFRHQLPGGEEVRLIDTPNQYRGLSEDRQPVILKIHGTVDRAATERDSFVITEDHYIDYLTHTDLANLVPVTLTAKLKKSHLLFMGYGLRDWNLRVILHRIWGEQKLSWKSWAIQCQPDQLDTEFWRKRDVDILDLDLKNYIAALSERIQALPQLGGAP